MPVVQLVPFDLQTSPPGRIMAQVGFWASLPRIVRGLPVARLLMVADNLRPEDVLDGFRRVAVPEEELPAGVMAYRVQYEDFIRQAVQETRYMRLYLVVDTTLDEEGLIRLLGTYGIRALPLDERGIPMPFSAGDAAWDRVVTDGGVWAMIRSRLTQSGALHPRVLHRLFALEFPVWAALQIRTFSNQEALGLLRRKGISAQYSKAQGEAAEEAQIVRQSVRDIRYELNRVGTALHTVRLYVLVGAYDESTLGERLAIVRGALPLDMEPWEASPDDIRRVFSADPLLETDGSPLTTTGLVILTGSALSYRRRTETRGVLLGTDTYQAPVVINVFDDRSPSYNMVVLGQTGAGKTFAVLLLMLRHLLLGVRLIIIDPQGNIDLSFLGAEICHKSVIGTSAASINILDIVHDEIGNQVESVCSMLTMLGVLKAGDNLGRAVLDEVLMDIYEPLWGRVAGTEVPTLEAVQRRLEGVASRAVLPAVRDTAMSLATTLSPYTRGSRAVLFGRPTTVDFSLRHPVTVYDVSRLPQQEQGGNLRAAQLAILVADVNQAIRQLRKAGDRAPILFFVDEMGILMRDAVIASYISAEYKTARARLVGMIVADQDLHSLLGPADERGLHHGVPILANAAFSLIFRQKGSEKGRIREFFPDLPDVFVERLPVLTQGTCVAQLPDDLLLVNVRPSMLDRIVLSSRLQDREQARRIIHRMVDELSGGFPVEQEVVV
ncbi:MAG TPA: hypothetical protein EYP52_06815 [Anaerolineae bacterium]|nr:hypothetical protein [Anaerolineae bacterium]